MQVCPRTKIGNIKRSLASLECKGKRCFIFPSRNKTSQMKLFIVWYCVLKFYSAEVAKHLTEDSYGLIFGVNTFLALALQSALTLIVVSEGGLGLKIHPQVSELFL